MTRRRNWQTIRKRRTRRKKTRGGGKYYCQFLKFIKSKKYNKYCSQYGLAATQLPFQQTNPLTISAKQESVITTSPIKLDPTARASPFAARPSEDPTAPGRGPSEDPAAPGPPPLDPPESIDFEKITAENVQSVFNTRKPTILYIYDTSDNFANIHSLKRVMKLKQVDYKIKGINIDFPTLKHMFPVQTPLLRAVYDYNNQIAEVSDFSIPSITAFLDQIDTEQKKIDQEQSDMLGEKSNTGEVVQITDENKWTVLAADSKWVIIEVIAGTFGEDRYSNITRLLKQHHLPFRIATIDVDLMTNPGPDSLPYVLAYYNGNFVHGRDLNESGIPNQIDVYLLDTWSKIRGNLFENPGPIDFNKLEPSEETAISDFIKTTEENKSTEIILDDKSIRYLIGKFANFFTPGYIFNNNGALSYIGKLSKNLRTRSELSYDIGNVTHFICIPIKKENGDDSPYTDVCIYHKLTNTVYLFLDDCTSGVSKFISEKKPKTWFKTVTGHGSNKETKCEEKTCNNKFFLLLRILQTQNIDFLCNEYDYEALQDFSA
jgi:hypothetical protein